MFFGNSDSSEQESSKTATEEFLDFIKTSLVESFTEWAYDKDDDDVWLSNKGRKIYLRWDETWCLNRKDQEFPETIENVIWMAFDDNDMDTVWPLALTKEQATEVITWRDEWKATYALRKCLK